VHAGAQPDVEHVDARCAIGVGYPDQVETLFEGAPLQLLGDVFHVGEYRTRSTASGPLD
jgi:hypothetical protein